ncbi:MAG: phospho-N-acetylmuramoyl-pentapeptide-transferase [Candidatus Riflebacteria bacterium]|nr:phospho-N-acetylmuramoyl-pentapeptide-transferase [Candidatus Riflebacteria bacterium]
MLTLYVESILVRFLLSFFLSFILTLIIGPHVVEALKRRQIGQSIREEGVQEHKKKAGIPTMGGIMILLPVCLMCILFAKPTYPLLAAFLAMFANAVIGGLDDLTKVLKARSLGLTPRQKLFGQITIGILTGIAARYFFSMNDTQIFNSAENTSAAITSGSVFMPFYGMINLGLLYIPFVTFVLVGSSNAVNLTDGLDGLAGGTGFIAFSAFAFISLICGNSEFARLLSVPYLPECRELAVLCGALMGGCLGFLWFNANPAQVFMGDTGSLALGGALGATAVCLRNEVILCIIGGIFVAEALSVIIQVSYFKYSGGKRVFRMSPIHHHFELCGWPEQKVVARFCITGLLFAIAGISLLVCYPLVNNLN